MENASKALLMAAGILIAIMVISLMIYLFVVFGSYAKGVHDENDIKALESFNVQFTQYENTKRGQALTIQDVITIVTLARNNNLDNQISEPSVAQREQSFYITVIDGVTPKIGIENLLKEVNETEYNKKCNQMIFNNINEKFECSTERSDITGRVYKVTIKKL